VRSNYTDCHYRECRQIPRQFFVVWLWESNQECFLGRLKHSVMACWLLLLKMKTLLVWITDNQDTQSVHNITCVSSGLLIFVWQFALKQRHVDMLTFISEDETLSFYLRLSALCFVLVVWVLLQCCLSELVDCGVCSAFEELFPCRKTHNH
jgi:hypothetical protein